MRVACTLLLCVGCSGAASTTPPPATDVPVASVRAPPMDVAPKPLPNPGEGFRSLASFVTRARTDCRTLHPVVEVYRVNHPGACPTTQQLLDEKEISAQSDLRDPWGQPYAIQCADDESFVSSAGPDGKFGTKDDIVIPEPRLGN